MQVMLMKTQTKQATRKISKELEMELVAHRLRHEELEMKLKGERYLTEEEAMKQYWEKRRAKYGTKTVEN